MKLKVFGGTSFANGKQVRMIVATTSQKKAAELTKIPLREISTYWSETRNDTEVAAAMTSPETVFASSSVHTMDFKPLASAT